MIVWLMKVYSTEGSFAGLVGDWGGAKEISALALRTSRIQYLGTGKGEVRMIQSVESNHSR